MQKELFRKTALQKLSSPDQLDQLIRIVDPKSWVALTTLSVLIAAALLWSIFGRLPSKVIGEGLLIKTSGVSSVTALGSGIITDIKDLTGGDRIAAGETIANVAQPILLQEIKAAEENVAFLNKERQRIRDFASKNLSLRQQSQSNQLANYRLSLTGKIDHLQSLERTLQAQDGLRKEGLITTQKYEATKQKVYEVKDEIAKIKHDIQQLSVAETELQNQLTAQVRDTEAKLAQAEQTLNALQLKLKQTSEVVSTGSGEVLEVVAYKGRLINEGAPILFFQVDGKNLGAVIYLPAEGEAKHIKPGMSVQISPVTVKKEEHGFVLGKIVSISEFPATKRGMAALFENDMLVDELTRKGTQVLAYVELLPDAQTVSGYHWSSKAGSSIKLSSGTLCKAAVTIREQAPITLVIPALKRFFGMA